MKGRNSQAILLCTGPQVVRLVTGAGDAMVFYPDLGDVEVLDALSTKANPVQISFPWRQKMGPVDVDLSGAWAEAAILWSTPQGTFDPWEEREIVAEGHFKSFSWRGPDEICSGSISSEAFRDDGEILTDDDLLSPDRFPDLENEDSELDRAKNSNGLFVPRIIAPVGSNAYCPLFLVQDTVDADGGDDIDYARLLASVRVPANRTETHQFRMVDADGGYYASPTDVNYQKSITSDRDELNARYYFVKNNFVQTYGTNVVFNTSQVITAPKQKKQLQIGDQTRLSGGGVDDWCRVESIEGETVNLHRVYPGTTGTSTGDVVRKPADVPYPGFRILAHGGEERLNGDGPVSNVIDVLQHFLAESVTNLPMVLADLDSFRPMLRHIDITKIESEEMSPWDWCQANLFWWLPIRPYREGGRIRFAWVGPTSSLKVAAVIDLDDLGTPATLGADLSYEYPEYPGLRLKYEWDIPSEKFKSSLLQNPAVATFDETTIDLSPIASGRAVRALQEWRSLSPISGRTPAPLLKEELDAIEGRFSAGQVAVWLTFLNAHRTLPIQIEIGQPLFFLKPGDLIQVKKAGALTSHAYFRVEQRRRKVGGVGLLVAESIS